MTRITTIVLALIGLGMVAGPAVAATPSELNERGKAAYTQGDYEMAARLFGEAATAAPSEPLYRYHLGAALVRLGRLAEARASYQEALRLKPPASLATTIQTAMRELPARAPAPRPRANDEVIFLESSKGVWFAEVLLNTTRRARFIVDTGATACTISPALAEELGIRISPDAPKVEVVTMSGKTTGRIVSLESIKVGNVEAKDVPTVVHEFPAGIDGILGNTFLARYAVTLDAQRRELHLRSRP